MEQITEIVFTEEFLYLLTSLVVFLAMILLGRTLDFEKTKEIILNAYNQIKNLFSSKEQ